MVISLRFFFRRVDVFGIFFLFTDRFDIFFKKGKRFAFRAVAHSTLLILNGGFPLEYVQPDDGF